MGVGRSLCSTCTKYLLEDLAGQLYKTSMLFPAKGASFYSVEALEGVVKVPPVVFAEILKNSKDR